MTRTPAAPESAPRVARDHAIDVLRGWAMVLMIASHVGARSHLNTLLHLPFWISAATPFVLLSGVVLGMRARAGIRPATAYRRAAHLWAIHVALSVAVLATHEATGRLDVPWLADLGGLSAAAWMIPILRLQSSDYMNILPLFVVFMAAAPVLVLAMQRTWWPLCVAASLLLWSVTQRDPGWFRFTDPRCGPESFVLPAWQMHFVLGLAAGFHFVKLKAALGSSPRTVSALFVLVGALFVLAQMQRNVAVGLGARLPPSWSWLAAKETCGPLRTIYELGLMLLLYLALERGRAAGQWLKFAQPLAMMGKKSLYCFLMHLPFALLGSGFGLFDRPGWVQDLGGLTALGSVYAMARWNVLGRYVPN